MTETTRTQDEIVARIRAVARDDMFGWKRDVLIPQLDFEHAQEFLVAGTTAEQWAADVEADGSRDVTTASAKYLAFAFGKAYGERGLSAGRSVDKLAEYAWLLGRDDVAAQLDDSDAYGSYGLPQLITFAKAFDLPVPSRDEVGS